MAGRQPECGICMDSFKNPKVISCHHSFCYKCLEDYVRVNLRNGRFDCPICRTNIELLSEGVPGFHANVYVNHDYAEKEPSLQAVNRDVAEGSYLVDFTPRYVWSGGPRRSGGISHWARGMGGRGRTKYQAKHSSLSLQEDIELHHAKEPWIPKCLAARIDHGGEDIRSEELFKKVRSILNKLTPQKFQTLVAKMQALEIGTERSLKDVIDIVFETAICDPRYSTAYANMCRCLSMFKVPAESKQGDVNFRAMLLTRCQQEFEKANSSEKEIDSKRKAIEKATTEKEKQQMKEELEDEEMKAKKRSLGNIRFIGELFKLKMLTENIMHDCVFKLLRTKNEENLECLCTLLKTTCKELDTDKAKPRMDQYFAQMVKIVNEKKLSSRVRFMLQDVIELRKKLELAKVRNSAPTSTTVSMAIPKIEESLNDLITNKGCSNEEVFDWIDREVDELTIKQEYFIRALMTAVCKSAVTVSSKNLMKVDKSQIQKRNNLLQKYLDHQANFELQALFALQALVHKLKHPPGVLRELFDILYDEDIISEDAFIQWEKSEDPREQEGKSLAMKQVVQFFTWLREAEDDVES